MSIDSHRYNLRSKRPRPENALFVPRKRLKPMDVLTNLSKSSLGKAIVGRDVEVRALGDILSGQLGNARVLLSGKPQVGKRSVVLKLAYHLNDYQVAEINCTALKGLFSDSQEQVDALGRAIRQVQEELCSPIIFFRNMDQLLDEPLLRDRLNVLLQGDARVIGSTQKEVISGELKKRLARFRMQEYPIGECSSGEAKEILRDRLKERRIEVSDTVLHKTVEYAERFFHNVPFPVKALNLLDRALAEKQRRGQEALSEGILSHVVSEKVNFNAGIVFAKPWDLPEMIERGLKKEVVGQASAVSTIVSKLSQRLTGASGEREGPWATFFFPGPTGCGKTLTAKVLSRLLYHSKDAFIRYDMSEFNDDVSANRFIGASAGYVGHEEGGQLVTALMDNPYRVVLFDEIEKAHPKVLDVLLQVLDAGRMTDGLGRTALFKNAVVIMTTNIGGEHIIEHKGSVDSLVKDILRPLVSREIRPEFVGRIAEDFVPFEPLTKQHVRPLVEKELGRRRGQKYTLTWSEDVVTYFQTSLGLSKYGPRHLRRQVADRVSQLLNQYVLRNQQMLEGEFELHVHQGTLGLRRS